VYQLANTTGWPVTVLHAFAGGEGAAKVPSGNLVFGPGNLLYGITGDESDSTYALQGTDFSVSPAGDTTEFEIINTFGHPGEGAGPTGLVPVPGSSYLVGVTNSGSGTFYSLEATKKGTGKLDTLYTFTYGSGGGTSDVNSPNNPPIVGYGALRGSAFGCASGGGTGNAGFGPSGGIYQMNESQGSTAESVIFDFPDSQYPYANGSYYCEVIQGSNAGTIYGITGTTENSHENAFFQLTPPKLAGGAWTEQVLLYFDTAGAYEPQYPIAKVGNNYYIAFKSSDGSNNNDGVVMQIAVEP
jgi:hypothetical protein